MERVEADLEAEVVGGEEARAALAEEERRGAELLEEAEHRAETIQQLNNQIVQAGADIFHIKKG